MESITAIGEILKGAWVGVSGDSVILQNTCFLHTKWHLDLGFLSCAPVLEDAVQKHCSFQAGEAIGDSTHLTSAVQECQHCSKMRPEELHRRLCGSSMLTSGLIIDSALLQTNGSV